MSQLDKETLRVALRAAAEDVAISKGSAARVVDEVTSAKSEELTARGRRRHNWTDRSRKIVPGIAAVVVALCVALPLLRLEGGAPAGRTSATGSTEKVVHGSAPQATSTGALSPTLTVTGSGVSSTSAATPSTKSLKVEEVGTIDVVVAKDQFTATVSELSSLAQKYGGFITNTHLVLAGSGSSSYSSGTVVVQVPQAKFASLEVHVRDVGRTTSIQTSTTDVTEHYVDLGAQIASLEASREQYLRIMSRATSISGILAVQRQLTSLQSQIEQLQSQMNLLKSETTYGTLTVSLSQAGHPRLHARPLTGFRRAWHESVSGFLAGLEWLLRLAGPILFSLLLLGALYLFGRLVWRARPWS